MLGSKLHIGFPEITEIDVKKCGESEKTGFNELKSLQKAEKLCFW